MVVVVDHDKISELQVASSAGSFTSNALHRTTISKECEGMVVDQLEARLVELGSCVGLCNRKTDGVCKTLAEGTSSYFYARCILSFGMTGCDAVYGLYRRVESAATEEPTDTKREETYSEGFQIV